MKTILPILTIALFSPIAFAEGPQEFTLGETALLVGATGVNGAAMGAVATAATAGTYIYLSPRDEDGVGEKELNDSETAEATADLK